MVIFSVYADGSSMGTSHGACGWGWAIVQDHRQIVAQGFGGAPQGTNNLAELMAAREGIRALLETTAYQGTVQSGVPFTVELVSDSQYVLGIASGDYNPTVNLALAAHVYDICHTYNIKMRWVRGHTGDPVNELCDKLAKQGKYLHSEPPTPNKRSRRRARKAKLDKIDPPEVACGSSDENH